MDIPKRSIRLDDEVYARLQALPGKTVNDGMRGLLFGDSSAVGELAQAFNERMNILRDAIYALNDKLEEILETVQSVPSPHEHLQSARVGFDPASIPGISQGYDAAKNAFCKHCGSKFAGLKFASICASCESTGHQNVLPADCAGCQRGVAL